MMASGLPLAVPFTSSAARLAAKKRNPPGAERHDLHVFDGDNDGTEAGGDGHLRAIKPVAQARSQIDNLYWCINAVNRPSLAGR